MLSVKAGTTLLLKTDMSYVHSQTDTQNVYTAGPLAVTTPTGSIVCQLPQRLQSGHDVLLTHGTRLEVMAIREVWHSRFAACKAMHECPTPFASTEVLTRIPGTSVEFNVTCTRSGSDENLTKGELQPMFQNILEWM